jgi:hypothetical protein
MKILLFAFHFLNIFVSLFTFASRNVSVFQHLKLFAFAFYFLSISGCSYFEWTSIVTFAAAAHPFLPLTNRDTGEWNNAGNALVLYSIIIYYINHS